MMPLRCDTIKCLFNILIWDKQPCLLMIGNTKGGSITVLLTSCLTGLESAVWKLTIFVFICKIDLSKPSQTGGQWYSGTSLFSVPCSCSCRGVNNKGRQLAWQNIDTEEFFAAKTTFLAATFFGGNIFWRQFWIFCSSPSLTRPWSNWSDFWHLSCSLNGHFVHQGWD